VLAAVEEMVEVAVRERVVEPDKAVHVSLVFPRATGKLEGELRLDRAQVDQTARCRPSPCSEPLERLGTSV